MAARMSKTIQPSNSTDALFRIWSQWMFDALIAGGWVQTADTGQINFTTVLKPAAGTTKQGYVILRMDDTLQATSPVYLRLDFGSGSGANNPSVWITLGSGSDGAGTITSPAFFGPQQVPASSSATANSPSYSFASCSTNRAAFAMFTQPSSGSFALAFSIERAKSSSGADSSDGLIIAYANNSSNLDRIAWAYTSAVPQPPTENALVFVLSQRNPTAASQNVGIGVPFPFNGLAQSPGKSWMVGLSGDWNVYSRIRTTVYDETVTYQGLGSSFRISMQGSSSSFWILYMRFD